MSQSRKILGGLACSLAFGCAQGEPCDLEQVDYVRGLAQIVVVTDAVHDGVVGKDVDRLTRKDPVYRETDAIMRRLKAALDYKYEGLKDFAREQYSECYYDPLDKMYKECMKEKKESEGVLPDCYYAYLDHRVKLESLCQAKLRDCL